MQRTLQRRLERRGRERDAEATREAILNAAQELFARDGFSGARVDDIAAHAGYNKALIFHYFDDKLGLYRALMLRTKQHLFARFEKTVDRIFAADGEGEDAVDGEGAIDERIRTLTAEYIDALFDLYAEHPEAMRVLAWEAAEGWQTYVNCAPSMPDTWSQRVLALLQRAQVAGIIRAELDPYLLFTTLISLPLIHLISLPRYAAMFPGADFTSPAAIAHAREQITELVLYGILSPVTPHSNNLEVSHSSQTTLARSEGGA